LLEVRRFTPFNPDATSFVSRLVVHPAFRRTYLMGKVVRDVYRFHCEQGIALMFADCRPGLLPIYTRLGMRTYKAGFRDPKYVWVVPLVLVINDIEYLEAMRSPFLPIARRFPASTAGRAVLESLYEGAVITAVQSVQTQPDSWNLLKEQIFARAGTAGRHTVLQRSPTHRDRPSHAGFDGAGD
jgi:hypothetical protein